MIQRDSKILVAGGTGLVGSAIVRSLLNSGCKDITATFFKRTPLIKSENVHYHRVDLTDQSETFKFLNDQRPDLVFMAAGRVGGIEANNTQRAQFIYENLQMITNVIHYSYTIGVKKLLFLGSSCIYPRECPQPIKEEYLLTAPLEYTNEPYAVAKIAGIRLCESYNIQYGTNFISVMPTNLFGENDNFNLRTSHVLPAMLRKFYLARLLRDKDYGSIEKDLQRYELGYEIKGSIEETLKGLGVTADAVEIWGSGRPRRDFLYVDDLADACLFVMDRVNFDDLTKGLREVKNTHINIGSGEDISIADLAEMVRQIVGFKGEIVYNTSKPDGMMLKKLDNSKIHALGWRPKIGLKEGIERVYKSYVKNSQGLNL